jgi:putative ABC transport system permease protein
METIRRAVRSLIRSPGYAATAIGSIAVGLALATATFAMVDAMLHPKLPFADPDQLYSVQLRFGNQKNPPSVGEQLRLVRSLPLVEDAAAIWSGRIRGYTTTRAGGMPLYATPGLWSMLGVRPELGRLPVANDGREGRSVLVRRDIWERDLQKRTSLDGASLRYNDRFYDVIGVMPMKPARQLGGIAFVLADERAALDTLRISTFTQGGARIIVRLRAGATPESMQGDLAHAAANLTSQYVTGSAPPYRIDLVSMRPRIRNLSEFEVLFLGLAFGVLAIGCTNVAALALARGLKRQRDIALRRALGASRGKVAGEVLAEVGILAVIGGALGLVLTIAMLGALAGMIPEELTWGWLEPPVMNFRVFGAAAAAMIAAIALAGAAPAIHASRVSPSEPLKDGAGTTTGRMGSQFRALVIGELAIAMVLLMMASLMSLSIRNRLTFDFGFEATRLATAQLSLMRNPGRTSGADLSSMRRRTIEMATATPGVRSVALMNYRPMVDDIVVSDRTSSGEPSLELRSATSGGPGFFATMGIPIVAGRDIAEGDIGEGAVVLSERAAAALFPRGDAIGRRIKSGKVEGSEPWVRVVGISKDFTLTMAPDRDLLGHAIVFSDRESATNYWSLAIRTEGDPVPVIRAMTLAFRDALPERSSAYVARFMDAWEPSFLINGFFARIFGVLGFAAMLLSAFGMFSVLSYVVGHRHREFAIRVSLGATQGNVARVVLRTAFECALGGTAIGALLSFWASAGVSGMLFGVKNTDPTSLIVAELVLIGVTLLAGLGPAIRASRANPLDVIRAA